MRFVRSSLAVLAGLALGACASAGVGAHGGGDPAVAIARLEKQRAASPKSEPVLRALGIAYYRAHRYGDARATLTQAATLDPRDGTTALFLGLTAEQQNDLPAAREAYSSYLKVGRTKQVRRQLEARMSALAKKELQVAAKAAVQQEAQLAGQPGAPNVVAVMPMTFSGADTSLKPLERGMSDLLITDLARSSQLTIVERARLQALLAEMDLQRSGATDSTTRARAGRMLRAGRVVQGSILQQGEALRVDAAIVDVPTTKITGTTADDRALAQLFQLEKNIALGLLDRLGVRLTVAERNLIEQRPTRSLAAFLAYSRGLAAEDDGRFDEAARYYQQAAKLDPSFTRASEKARQAEIAAVGVSSNVATVEASILGTPEGSVSDQAMQGSAAPTQPTGPSTSGSLGIAVNELNASTAGAATGSAATSTSTSASTTNPSDGTGSTEPGSSTAKVIIIIPRPQ